MTSVFPILSSVPAMAIVARMCCNNDLGSQVTTVCSDNECGSCNLSSSYEKCDRQLNMDGPITCSLHDFFTFLISMWQEEPLPQVVVNIA
jgi:hypothetical protein